MQLQKLLNISNSLSFIRIIISIPIFYYIAVSNELAAIAYIILAIITDILDGYFARKFNQITPAGKIIDPIADKICTISGFLALTLYKDFPFWMTGLIILRDILILLGSLLIWRNKKFIFASNIPGKLTMLSISLLGLSYLFNIENLKDIFLIVTVFFLLFSFIMYLRVYIKNIK